MWSRWQVDPKPHAHPLTRLAAHHVISTENRLLETAHSRGRGRGQTPVMGQKQLQPVPCSSRLRGHPKENRRCPVVCLPCAQWGICTHHSASYIPGCRDREARREYVHLGLGSSILHPTCPHGNLRSFLSGQISARDVAWRDR